MNLEPGKARTANLLLPFALFGFLAPIATYLVAVSNLTPDLKTTILSILAVSYALLFVISFKRLRTTVNERSSPVTVIGSERSEPVQIPIDEADKYSCQDVHTGLLNEPAFRMVLEHEIAESLRDPEDRSLSVLTIEIRDVKKLAEKYGDDAEDRILNHSAHTITRSLRAMDFAAYLGGGEFAVILPAADESGAIETSRRIDRAFSESPFEFAEGQIANLYVFIGSATFARDGDTSESLVEQARTRKREAKANANPVNPDRHAEYLH